MTTRARVQYAGGGKHPREVQNLNCDSSTKDAKAFAAALPFKLLILSTRFCLKRLKDPPKLLYVVTIYTLHDRDELLVRLSVSLRENLSGSD